MPKNTCSTFKKKSRTASFYLLFTEPMTIIVRQAGGADWKIRVKDCCFRKGDGDSRSLLAWQQLTHLYFITCRNDWGHRDSKFVFYQGSTVLQILQTLIGCPHEKARKVFGANSSCWFAVTTWKSTEVMCLAQGPNAIELAVLWWHFKVFAVHFFTFKAGSAESLITLRLTHYRCLLISVRLDAAIVQGCSSGVM